MNKFIFIIAFILNTLNLYSQNIEQNLKKYWYYRSRLKEKFVYINSGNEKGSNIPVEIFGEFELEPNTAPVYAYYFGDGNGNLPYYIGMLATEYRLLKDYGQDYTQTLNELIYALQAFERLDASAESYYRPNHEVFPEDLNGIKITLTPNII